jgi:hypothetical protein
LRIKCLSFGYIAEKVRALGKAYGIKKSVIENNLGEQVGEHIKEPIENLRNSSVNI